MSLRLPEDESLELDEERWRFCCLWRDFEDFLAFFFSLRFLDLRRLEASELEESSEELEEGDGEGFFFLRLFESLTMIVVDCFLRRLVSRAYGPRGGFFGCETLDLTLTSRLTLSSSSDSLSKNEALMRASRCMR